MGTLQSVASTWRNHLLHDEMLETHMCSAWCRCWVRCINKAPRTLASRGVTVIILVNAVIRMLLTIITHEQLLLTCINELYKSSPSPTRSCFMNISLTHAPVDGTALTRAELWMEWRDDKTSMHRAIALMHIAYCSYVYNQREITVYNFCIFLRDYYTNF